MRNLVRVALTAIFVVGYVIFGSNENICSAEAQYFVEDGSTPEADIHSVCVADIFFQSNRKMAITIKKINAIFHDDQRDFYFYSIKIYQRIDQNPFNIQSVVIMSESDSVEIPLNDSNQKKE